MYRNKIKSNDKENESFLYTRSPAVLSWRLDPDESLSDWTVKVRSSPDLEGSPTKYFHRYQTYCNKRSEVQQMYPPSRGDISSTKMYFVHRAQLAVGPRRSEFFVNVFQTMKYPNMQQKRDDSDSGRGISSKNKSTRIELIPAAASCFPIMLDYIYSGELAINTDSAVALRRLAASFGVRDMFRETTQFIQRDLTPNTATKYLLEAEKFKNHKIQSTAMNIIASNFLSIKLTALVCIPPELMKDIIQSAKLFVNDEIKFSTRIASYCRCVEDELTLTLLESFTSSKILSTIDYTESLYFLHLLFILKARDDSDPNLETMNLYQHCLVQVPKVLKSLLSTKLLTDDTAYKTALRKQKHDLELYNSLPACIKVHLLECSFESTKVPSAEIYCKAIPSLKENKAKKEVFKLQDEVKMLKVSYDKKVNYFQRLLDAKTNELKRFSESGRPVDFT